jgi:hypothetical protein
MKTEDILYYNNKILKDPDGDYVTVEVDGKLFLCPAHLQRRAVSLAREGQLMELPKRV